jgi:hypothetical protein
MVAVAGRGHYHVKIMSNHFIPIVTEYPFSSLVEKQDLMIFLNGYKGFIGIFDSTR